MSLYQREKVANVASKDLFGKSDICTKFSFIEDSVTHLNALKLFKQIQDKIEKQKKDDD